MKLSALLVVLGCVLVQAGLSVAGPTIVASIFGNVSNPTAYAVGLFFSAGVIEAYVAIATLISQNGEDSC
jgi:hypothetical protein